MASKTSGEPDLMQKVISLCKRRGFVFQSSEIYGGLKSCYDYGPLGIELKRNIMNEWWRSMVQERENIVGLDASIVMHPKVWEASGHLSSFSDPLVDCLDCKERFRADKAPVVEKGTLVSWKSRIQKKTVESIADRGYVCPVCSSPELSPERNFNLMFRSFMGSVDPMGNVADKLAGKNLDAQEIRKIMEEELKSSTVYLRPETAQAMFVQFANIQKSLSMKVPFGVAQMGKSFRNEVTVEHFIFRSCEFEQMEMEFFCQPGTQKEWMAHWKEERLNWYSVLPMSRINSVCVSTMPMSSLITPTIVTMWSTTTLGVGMSWRAWRVERITTSRNTLPPVARTSPISINKPPILRRVSKVGATPLM